MSVTQGQCDAKPTVTFPDTEHHHSLAGTKLYCLLGDSLTEAHVSEQIAHGCTRNLGSRQSNLRPVPIALSTKPPSHTNHGRGVLNKTYNADTRHCRRESKPVHNLLNYSACSQMKI